MLAITSRSSGFCGRCATNYFARAISWQGSGHLKAGIMGQKTPRQIKHTQIRHTTRSSTGSYIRRLYCRITTATHIYAKEPYVLDVTQPRVTYQTCRETRETERHSTKRLRQRDTGLAVKMCEIKCKADVGCGITSLLDVMRYALDVRLNIWRFYSAYCLWEIIYSSDQKVSI